MKAALREIVAGIGLAFGFGAGVAVVLVCAFALAGCSGPPEEPAKVLAAAPQHAAPPPLAVTPPPPEPVAQPASAPPVVLAPPMIPSVQIDTRDYVLVAAQTIGDGSVKEVRQPGLTSQSCVAAANEWLAGRDWKAETGRSAECQVGS